LWNYITKKREFTLSSSFSFKPTFSRLKERSRPAGEARHMTRYVPRHVRLRSFSKKLSETTELFAVHLRSRAGVGYGDSPGLHVLNTLITLITLKPEIRQ